MIVLISDLALCVASVLTAFYLRLGEWLSPLGEPGYPLLLTLTTVIPLSITFGLYRAIFRFSGGVALLTVLKVVAIHTAIFSTVFTFIGVDGVPRTVGFIQPLVLFLMLGGSRSIAGALLGESYRTLWRRRDIPRVLIYGAGAAGRQLASAVRSTGEMHLVGFVDDARELQGSTLNNLPIMAPDRLREAVSRLSVTDILLALPSAAQTRRADIVKQLKRLGVHVRTLPGLADMASGRVTISNLKELEIEDLLGRSPVPPDERLLTGAIEGKTILVSGAGGSIGSELCRQIALSRPANLLLVDNSEYNLYAIHQELTQLNARRADEGFAMVPLLASVVDAKRMDEIIETWRPDTIYHAAAYKHVPLVEHNPVEGVRNNVLGTLTIALLARQHLVPNFVLISTDKAVRPTNVMGASKRLAEIALQALQDDGRGQTCFSMVRFGNVLGSSGSVVPLFRQQIGNGGPITITHPEITRYFMTIPEAAQLVLQAGAMARGGDVFVLDMGEPVRIADLARNMIELSGLSIRDEDNPDGDIAIKFVGLRPGEKLYEELLIGTASEQTSHPRIMRAHEAFITWDGLNDRLNGLSDAAEKGDVVRIRAILRNLVPEYLPSADVVDFVAVAKHRRDLASAAEIAAQ